MESSEQNVSQETAEANPQANPVDFLQRYLLSPINPSAKWELTLRKRVTQALGGQRDATFLHGIRIALSEQDLSGEKEAILAALMDIELSRSAEYSKDDPRLNLKNLIRLALEIYIHHQHLPIIHEVVSRHINSLPFITIEEYLTSGPKSSYGKDRDRDLLSKLADMRGAEIESGARENEPAIQEILESRRKQEDEARIEVENAERERQVKEDTERQEEEKRKITERERNDKEIKSLQGKIDSITLLTPNESEDLYSYASGGYEILFDPRYDSYGVGSVGIHTDIRQWNVFKLGDTKISLNGISYHVDKYKTKKAKNKWETDYTNVDNLLLDELQDKWGLLKNKLYEELQLQVGTIAKLIEGPIRKEVEDKLNEIDARDDTESSPRYYGRNEEKSKAESRVAVLSKNIDYFSSIINSSNTPKEFTEPLQNILSWLEALKNEANHEIEVEQARAAEESRKIEERDRIEKIKEVKFDFLLNQIGAKATYLKELYELESGYDLGSLSGHGTRSNGASLGSVMSGVGAGVGAIPSANTATLRIEGPSDGIYIEMGDDLVGAYKRLNMEDFVAPHEIGHLMARTLDNADEKILSHYKSDITQIGEAFIGFELDEREAIERDIGHHLKECAVDAIGTKMALAYGVSDPFQESYDKRLLAHLDGFLSALNVVLEQLESAEQNRHGYEYFLIRAMANIHTFREKVAELRTDLIGNYDDVLSEAYGRAEDKCRSLNQKIGTEHREAILALYKKVLAFTSGLNFDELEKIK